MGARPFADLLREHRGGRTHDDLTEQLQALVQAVAETQKTGTLSVTFKIAPHGDGAAMVTVASTTKLPKAAPGGTIFFLTPENNLERQDPRQTDLPLRAVPAEAAPRVIGGTA